MALGLLALIPPFARSAVGIIEKAVGEGLNVDDIHSLLGAAGVPMSRTVLSQTIEYFNGAIDATDYIQALANNVLPNPDILSESLGTLRRQYSYIIRLTGYDPSTKETYTAFRTVASSRLLSKAEAENIALSNIEDQGIDYTIQNFWRDGNDDPIIVNRSTGERLLEFTVASTQSLLKAGPYGTL